MNYIYTWTIETINEAEAEVEVDVHIRAASVIHADRKVREFLARHNGGDWTVQRVSRRVARDSGPAICTESNNDIGAFSVFENMSLRPVTGSRAD